MKFLLKASKDFRLRGWSLKMERFVTFSSLLAIHLLYLINFHVFFHLILQTINNSMVLKILDQSV